jgi:large subunit ribosomal protein L4
MDIQVMTPDNSGKTSNLQVSDAVFGREFNQDLVHQIIVAHQAGARQGTQKQKSRSEVNGSTKKPWRQKGTGRARAGMRMSPLWRKGGVTFAARPRDYSQKVNRKMYRSAICSILSELLRTGRLLVVENIALADHKTKTCAAWLNKFDLTDALIITDNMESNLLLGSRNLPRIHLTDSSDISPIDLVHYDKIVITKQALQQLEERLA